MINSREEIKAFTKFITKLELSFWGISVLLGIVTTIYYGWWSGVKISLGSFFFMQPFFIYAYKEVLLILWKEQNKIR